VISAMRAGAADFVVKPVGPERLQVSLRNALAASALETEFKRLKSSRSGTLTFRDVITRNPAMLAALRTAQKAAGCELAVLLEGEPGVGKELIARAIHGSGARRCKPFVAVHCGAIPEALLESTLFGPEPGALMGASKRDSGKFVEASGGTLFLDEVSELPPAAQLKLLRAIEQGEVESVGGRRPIAVDVRLISASNRDLLAAVKDGRFREDLFYQLHVLPIVIPPLRQRSEDIPALVRHFLARSAAQEGKRIRSVSAAAMSLLCHQCWPGNVRQLENAIFLAVVLAGSDEIDVAEFPQIAAQSTKMESAGVDRECRRPPVGPEAIGVLAIDDLRPVPLSPEVSPEVSPGLTATGLSIFDPEGEVRPLAEIEVEVLRLAIAHYDGHMSQVARKLRIGRSTLYRRLKDLGLETRSAGELSLHHVAAE
jgi:DNA-binding NtrC family response regulator